MATLWDQTGTKRYLPKGNYRWNNQTKLYYEDENIGGVNISVGRASDFFRPAAVLSPRCGKVFFLQESASGADSLMNE